MRVVAGGCLLALWLSAGCSPTEQKPLGTASGTVKFQGRPLTTGTITFTHPTTGASYVSSIDQEGHFRFEVAAGYGLPPGEYRVAISPYTPTKPSIHYVDPDMSKKDYPPIPAKYQNPDTSGMLAVVSSGSNPEFLFEIP
jgi:hypothetical protein